MNPAKCEIVAVDSVNEEAVSEKFSKVADQIKLIQKERLPLLGPPVLQSKLTSRGGMLNQLEQMDAHEALFPSAELLCNPIAYLCVESMCFF